jgi:serine/threonine-protein kinase
MSIPPRSSRPHTRFGRYELLSWLGEGGFAEVWLARVADDDTAPPVAVKVMRRSRSRDAQQKAMFLDEAHLAAQIHHPNVASVLEVGDVDGVLFIAMEYVSGGSLDVLLQGARALGEQIPPGITLRLMADVCAGLHAAHELMVDGRAQHVIHRDVSPQNILITEEGAPKLIDFGIAKARERLSRETSTGITKGKLAYMSPEQARGAEIDRRADIWALAALAYELLEGRRVIEGPNEIARLNFLVNRPLQPTFTHTPAAAIGLLERALAFYPRDRQATAAELGHDFERAIEESGLATSRDETARYLERARDAAGDEDGPPSLGALLGAGTAEATVSDIRPPLSSAKLPLARSSTQAWLGVAVAVAVIGIITGLGLVAPRRAVSTITPPLQASSVGLPPPGEPAGVAARPSPMSSEAASDPKPMVSAVASAAEPQPAAAAPPSRSAPERPALRAPRSGAAKAGAAPAHTTTRPKDDDQIE